MRLPYFHLDAFSSRPFAGNPAGVVVLDRWLDDATHLAIAAEQNLAETAFVVRGPEGWEIRWWTPELEFDLCGHATLAAGAVVLERYEPGAPEVRFASRSAGPLVVRRDGARFALDFPSRPATPCPPPPALVAALGRAPAECLRARDLLVVLEREADVRAFRADPAALAAVDAIGVILTAPGERSDFVSRYFAPRAGIPEDPVTGSAHCTLVPYWSRRLGRTSLHALQVSRRGGELFCEDRGERVWIGGGVAAWLEGTITIP